MCCLTTITDSTKTRNYASKIIFVPHFTEKINFVKMLTHPPPFDSNFSCGILFFLKNMFPVTSSKSRVTSSNPRVGRL